MPAEYLPYLFSQSLSVPLSENHAELQAMVLETSEAPLILGFSSAVALVDFMGDRQAFTELAPQALLAHCLETKTNLGFDLGQAHAVLLDETAMTELIDILKSREGLEEVTGFEFENLTGEDALCRELEKNLPENIEAWLAKERNKGWLLFVHMPEFEDEAEAVHLQLKLRQVLLSLENAEALRLLAFPFGHRKWPALRAELNSYAISLKTDRIEGARAIPILRF